MPSPDEARDIRLVTATLIEQLERPQIDGEIWSGIESEFNRPGQTRRAAIAALPPRLS
jgi:hypothetical protein